MNAKQIQEILEIFSEWKMRFPYYKDRYAAMLLAYFVGPGRSVREVKASQFRGLLQKPLLKNLIRQLPDGRISREVLELVEWPSMPEIYYLTLGEWGHHSRRAWYWRQTSRPGKNLVLQLNFSSRHDRRYENLIRPEEDYHPFTGYGHPVNRDGLHTLAWARLDFDLQGESALIEEIQTDWLRFARWRLRSLEGQIGWQSRRGQDTSELTAELQRLTYYIDQDLVSHLRIWDEAVLMAAIRFLYEEIGLKRIYYHTVESGIRLKGFDPRREPTPPRSLYSQLPQRFCFREVDRIPGFLRHNRSRKLRKNLRLGGFKLFRLALDQDGPETAPGPSGLMEPEVIRARSNYENTINFGGPPWRIW